MIDCLFRTVRSKSGLTGSRLIYILNAMKKQKQNEFENREGMDKGGKIQKKKMGFLDFLSYILV